jgi:hypothetical protein
MVFDIVIASNFKWGFIFFLSSIDNDFFYIFNSKSAFGLSVDTSFFIFRSFIDYTIFRFDFSIDSSIINVDLLIDAIIVILVLSVTRTVTFNPADRFRFLVSRLSSTSNEVQHYFFVFPLITSISYLSSILNQLCLFNWPFNFCCGFERFVLLMYGIIFFRLKRFNWWFNFIWKREDFYCCPINWRENLDFISICIKNWNV